MNCRYHTAIASVLATDDLQLIFKSGDAGSRNEWPISATVLELTCSHLESYLNGAYQGDVSNQRFNPLSKSI
jgi:hypothetical protein